MPARSAVIKASDLRSAPLLATIIKDFDGLPAEAWHAWLKDSPALRHFAIESRGVADLRASLPQEHTRKKDTLAKINELVALAPDLFSTTEVPEACAAYIDPQSSDAGHRIFRVIDALIVTYVAESVRFPVFAAQQDDKERFNILFQAARHTAARAWGSAQLQPVIDVLSHIPSFSLTLPQARKFLALHLEHNRDDQDALHPIEDKHIDLLKKTYPNRAQV